MPSFIISVECRILVLDLTYSQALRRRSEIVLQRPNQSPEPSPVEHVLTDRGPGVLYFNKDYFLSHKSTTGKFSLLGGGASFRMTPPPLTVLSVFLFFFFY